MKIYTITITWQGQDTVMKFRDRGERDYYASELTAKWEVNYKLGESNV